MKEVVAGARWGKMGPSQVVNLVFDSAAKFLSSEKRRFRWGSEMSPHLKKMRCRANVREKVFHSSRKTTQGGVLQRNHDLRADPRQTSTLVRPLQEQEPV